MGKLGAESAMEEELTWKALSRAGDVFVVVLNSGKGVEVLPTSTTSRHPC